MSLAQLKKMEQVERIGGDKKVIKVVGTSVFLFKPTNCIR